MIGAENGGGPELSEQPAGPQFRFNDGTLEGYIGVTLKSIM